MPRRLPVLGMHPKPACKLNIPKSICPNPTRQTIPLEKKKEHGICGLFSDSTQSTMNTPSEEHLSTGVSDVTCFQLHRQISTLIIESPLGVKTRADTGDTKIPEASPALDSRSVCNDDAFLAKTMPLNPPKPPSQCFTTEQRAEPCRKHTSSMLLPTLSSREQLLCEDALTLTLRDNRSGGDYGPPSKAKRDLNEISKKSSIEKSKTVAQRNDLTKPALAATMKGFHSIVQVTRGEGQGSPLLKSDLALTYVFEKDLLENSAPMNSKPTLSCPSMHTSNTSCRPSSSTKPYPSALVRRKRNNLLPILDEGKGGGQNSATPLRPPDLLGKGVSRDKQTVLDVFSTLCMGGFPSLQTVPNPNVGDAEHGLGAEQNSNEPAQAAPGVGVGGAVAVAERCTTQNPALSDLETPLHREPSATVLSVIYPKLGSPASVKRNIGKPILSLPFPPKRNDCGLIRPGTKDEQNSVSSTLLASTTTLESFSPRSRLWVNTKNASNEAEPWPSLNNSVSCFDTLADQRNKAEEIDLVKGDSYSTQPARSSSFASTSLHQERTTLLSYSTVDHADQGKVPGSSLEAQGAGPVVEKPPVSPQKRPPFLCQKGPRTQRKTQRPRWRCLEKSHSPPSSPEPAMRIHPPPVQRRGVLVPRLRPPPLPHSQNQGVLDNLKTNQKSSAAEMTPSTLPIPPVESPKKVSLSSSPLQEMPQEILPGSESPRLSPRDTVASPILHPGHTMASNAHRTQPDTRAHLPLAEVLRNLSPKSFSRARPNKAQEITLTALATTGTSPNHTITTSSSSHTSTFEKESKQAFLPSRGQLKEFERSRRRECGQEGSAVLDIMIKEVMQDEGSSSLSNFIHPPSVLALSETHSPVGEPHPVTWKQRTPPPLLVEDLQDSVELLCPPTLRDPLKENAVVNAAPIEKPEVDVESYEVREEGELNRSETAGTTHASTNLELDSTVSVVTSISSTSHCAHMHGPTLPPDQQRLVFPIMPYPRLCELFRNRRTEKQEKPPSEIILDFDLRTPRTGGAGRPSPGAPPTIWSGISLSPDKGPLPFLVRHPGMKSDNFIFESYRRRHGKAMQFGPITGKTQLRWPVPSRRGFRGHIGRRDGLAPPNVTVSGRAGARGFAWTPDASPKSPTRGGTPASSEFATPRTLTMMPQGILQTLTQRLEGEAEKPRPESGPVARLLVSSLESEPVEQQGASQMTPTQVSESDGLDDVIVFMPQESPAVVISSNEQEGRKIPWGFSHERGNSDSPGPATALSPGWKHRKLHVERPKPSAKFHPLGLGFEQTPDFFTEIG